MKQTPPRWCLSLLVVSSAVAGIWSTRTSARADAPSGHFDAPGDGTVRDNATGLVWQQGSSPTGHTPSSAVAYCDGLALSGGGWRLPSILELRSIVDESRTGPAIDTAFFPGTYADYYWSSTPVVGSPGLAWSVQFEYGGATVNGSPTNLFRARCVR